ncbi:MAG: ribonuclease P protein component [Verrucomicrobiota bacterium]|nr:ribonuclease P protein component [Verrucomicrobiota bacterium]
MSAPEPGRLAFPKTRRLTRTAEFLSVKTHGRTHRSALLIVGTLETAGAAEAFRAGFVTSKRVGGAVVRNRVRRRLREIVRQHQSAVREGVWVVTIARPAAAQASYAALEDDWLRLAKRASILRASCS